MGGESPDDYNNITNDLSHPVKKDSHNLSLDCTMYKISTKKIRMPFFSLANSQIFLLTFIVRGLNLGSVACAV